MNVVLKENVVDDTLGIFEYLHAIDREYRKQYKGMYGRQMTVPRGQASFTISNDIHYNYKVAGGSPPNQVMCNRLKYITNKVNKIILISILFYFKKVYIFYLKYSSQFYNKNLLLFSNISLSIQVHIPYLPIPTSLVVLYTSLKQSLLGHSSKCFPYCF